MSKRHTCYFHKSQHITSFCTNPQCTLPMCDQCLPIHSQEYLEGGHQHNILPFYQAEELAIISLKNQVNSASQHRKQCEEALQTTKTKINKILNAFYEQYELYIKKLMEQVSEIEKKASKIQKGSLKTLIYYFSPENNHLDLKNISENLELKAKKVQQLFKKNQNCFQPTTVRNLNPKQEQKVQHRINAREIKQGREQSNNYYQHHHILNHQSSEHLKSFQNYDQKREISKFSNDTRNRIQTQVGDKKVYNYQQFVGERNGLRQSLQKQSFKNRQSIQKRENMRNYHGKSHQIRIEDNQWSKKPLLPSDLNIEYSNKNYSKNEDYERMKHQGNYKYTELNKQVLSPEQIKKMLEKRIAERSRLITKGKQWSEPKHEDSLSIHDQHQRNWDTKDSIINQIYNDYKN